MGQAHDYVQGMLSMAMYRNQTELEAQEEDKVNQTEIKPSRNNEVMIQDSKQDTNLNNSAVDQNANQDTINDANSSVDFDPLGRFKEKRESGRFNRDHRV